MKGKLEKLSDRQILKLKINGKCYHEIVEAPGDYGGSICKVCGYRRFEEWYCPDSPDHICHYRSEFDLGKRLRYVISVNREKIYLTKKYTKDFGQDMRESDDWCIFCGNPEERK
jgi:hypothetical protein